MLTLKKLAQELDIKPASVYSGMKHGSIDRPDKYAYEGNRKIMLWEEKTVQKIKDNNERFLNKKAREEKEKIAKLYSKGETLKSIAEIYRVSDTTIRSLLPRKMIRTYKSLPPEYIHPKGWNAANKAFNKAMRTT